VIAETEVRKRAAWMLEAMAARAERDMAGRRADDPIYREAAVSAAMLRYAAGALLDPPIVVAA